MKSKVLYFLYISYFSIILECVSSTNIASKNNSEGVCVLRGICGETNVGPISCDGKNDVIILKQIPQNIRSLSLLEAMCPHIYGEDEPHVCCDEFELESMYITIYNLAHLGFNQCPSCLENLEKLFCQLNCSPKQNRFIDLKKTKNTESGDYSPLEVDYYITESYAKGIFDSCKDVTNFKGKVVEMMCGEFTGQECTANRWLNYLGRSIEEDGISPFKINFHLTNESIVKIGENISYEPLNQSFIKCSEPTNKVSKACNCRHCSQSCDQNIEFKNEKLIETTRLKRKKRQLSGKCLMKGICGETAFGVIPCVSNEDPTPISDPIALEELREMCPHLAPDANLCCTDEQVIRLNRTFEMISMFLKECPACVRNFEKVICHLTCSSDQQKFMRITQIIQNDSQKDMVSEVEYFVNDDWAKGVFDSCKGVHRLGFNVLDHYCKPYKAKDCDHHKFLQFIGGNAEHFGHSPYEINFIFTNEQTVESNGVQYTTAKESFYKCSDNPHTGEGSCICNHCDESCAPGELRNIQKELPKYKPKTKREIEMSGNPEVFERYYDDLVQEFLDSETDLGKEFCLFDSICRHDPEIGNIPCLKIRKPEVITDAKDIDILREICPQLVNNDQPMTCCDSSLIHHMNIAFRLPAKLGLGKCVSCLHNFKQILCQFACSPKQNQMIRILNVTKIKENILIEHLEYYINNRFAQGLFDSCKSIHNGNVLNMMCGKWGLNKKCTAQRWLEFMGLSIKNGGYSPFQMDVKLTPETSLTINGKNIYPMNEKAFSCVESPYSLNNDSTTCDCENCREACI